MAILPHTTLRDILDREPHHGVTKAIEAWINDKLQRSVDDVLDASFSIKNVRESFVGKYTGRIYGIKPVHIEIDISVTFKDGFEAKELLYVR